MYVLIYPSHAISNLCLILPVGSLNNDRTVMSCQIAWRPLECLPILKGRACTNIDTEWQRLHSVGLYHKAMASIIAGYQPNLLNGLQRTCQQSL